MNCFTLDAWNALNVWLFNRCLNFSNWKLRDQQNEFEQRNISRILSTNVWRKHNARMLELGQQFKFYYLSLFSRLPWNCSWNSTGLEYWLTNALMKSILLSSNASAHTRPNVNIEWRLPRIEIFASKIVFMLECFDLEIVDEFWPATAMPDWVFPTKRVFILSDRHMFNEPELPLYVYNRVLERRFLNDALMKAVLN